VPGRRPHAVEIALALPRIEVVRAQDRLAHASPNRRSVFKVSLLAPATNACGTVVIDRRHRNIETGTAGAGRHR